MLKKLKALAKKVFIFVIANVVFFIYFVKPNTENRYTEMNQPKAKYYTAIQLSQINAAAFTIIVKQPCNCYDRKDINLTWANGRYVTFTDKYDNKINISENEMKAIRFTCGLYNFLKRGPNQKIISYSFYGNESRYLTKIATILKQMRVYYPKWVMRIYHNSSINNSYMCDVHCLNRYNNVDLCNVNELYMNVDDYLTKKPFNGEYLHGMMWRWLPFGDDSVDVFASRDTDSLIFVREVDAVNSWLKSGFYAHLMKDSPYQRAIMMGGLFDINNRISRRLSSQIFKLIFDPTIASIYNQNRSNRIGEDQKFLADHVYPLIRNLSLYHDSYKCNETGGVAWPSMRTGNCFVGVNSNCFQFMTGLNHSHLPDCPIECRPYNHTDWTKC